MVCRGHVFAGALPEPDLTWRSSSRAFGSVLTPMEKPSFGIKHGRTHIRYGFGGHRGSELGRIEPTFAKASAASRSSNASWRPHGETSRQT